MEKISTIFFIVLILLVVDSTNKEFIFFNVGQGDSAIYKSRDLRFIIDFGKGYVVSEKLSFYAFLDLCGFDYFFISHSDDDHAGGYDRIKTYCKGAKSASLYQNDILKINDKERLYVLWPPKDYVGSDNNGSRVLLYDNGAFEALFMGDLEESVFREVHFEKWLFLVENGVDVLKVSHHGSKNGVNTYLINLLKPRLCIVSVGANSYGHPSDEALDLFSESNCKIFRTDLRGDIHVQIP